MRSRRLFWIGLCLLLLAAGWFFWPTGGRPAKQNSTATEVVTRKSAGTAPQLFTAGKVVTNAVSQAAKTNLFPYRLANTKKPIGQLMKDGRVVLLANAFIDTRANLNLGIPKHLTATGDPGTYIVQSRAPMDAAFRAQLAAAGAVIVSYIPNNAYLVRMTAGGAATMAGQPMTSAVLPYEPYYKLSAFLLGAAVEQKGLPADALLTLGLFADNAAQTVGQIEKLGGTVQSTDQSPFGPIVRVIPPKNWTALASLAGVQIVEPARERAAANDLSRVALGISLDAVTNANYGGLTGSNVVVEVNDTGIDATHPDFTLSGNAASGPSGPSRVTGSSPLSMVDTNGHGTHVAGIIAGNGSESYSVTNPPQGSVTNADFRGKAPAATLYSVAALNDQGFKNVSDRYLQETPAQMNALISNNSWFYLGDNTYDLAAASYDAAVRDALAETMGSQPVLFVFAAGNDGGGNNSGGDGASDTVLSPGTAKNVITVGALEQLRNITNEVVDLDGTTNTPWFNPTDSSFDVAGYSARGNVGVGTEGDSGRFKPDVVAPGSFVISTRSQQWDQGAYYNPTNYERTTLNPELATPNTLHYYSLLIPSNAVGVTITLTPNILSPVPFPILPLYVKLAGSPNPASYDILSTNNSITIPPDSGGAISGIESLLGTTVSYAVGNTNNFDVSYAIHTVITTTNDAGNYFEVLSNLNETIGPFYRYESGTSMATPAVSGVLALMQDYFTNTLHATPSPALLKAMLINGARSTGNYNFVVTNGINFQGWGQPSVPNSVPPGITNQFDASCSSFFADQSPTNALATGDQRTWLVTVTTNDINAATQPLRVTLVWTDPPGDPVAASKLVNNLDLIVTNLTTGDVFYGNDFPYNSIFNSAWDTNLPPNADTVNNLENVYLSSADGDKYSVTVIGRGVNVNAVTAQTNNVVQDYALVISSGDGAVSNALSVADSTLVVHSTDAQLITYVTNSAAAADATSVGGFLLNQLVGANPALLGTNTIPVPAGSIFATNALITLGMTNQWHFYVVTNTTTFTNAAFVTFFANTLSVPRMGVYADSEANATQPEADIDLYVTTNPAITNLDPAAIAGADKSLGPGGTEFVVYANSVQNQVYYVGVKSETAEAAEYGFLSVFSQNPFSTMQDGKQVVNGLLLPVTIPDGNSAHPGVAYVFGLAIMPMLVQNVTVSNQITHQLFSDLVGVLNHGGKNVVLNNKAGLFSANDIYTNVYNDSGNGLLPGSTPSDGPGSLQNYQGLEAIGPWILTMVDNSQTATGAVDQLTFEITPHKDIKDPGVNISLQPGEFFVDYIDVPVGVINLTVSATNLPPTAQPPIQLYVSAFVPPTLGGTNGSMVLLTNCAVGTYPSGTFAGNSISTGPPLVPGRYYVGLYNPLPNGAHTVFLTASFVFSKAAITTADIAATNSTAIIDDAVSYASLFVTNLDLVQSFKVGVRVDHPRISDLVFHLITPDGARYLLMENRGALSTNGAGLTIITTNFTPVSSAGGPDATTNYVEVGKTFGSVALNWDFFTIPDTMDVYYEGTPIFSTGLVNGTGSTELTFGPGVSTQLEIVMNATNHPPATAWTYSVGGVQTNYYYLTFTQDTNLTTTPIKFAPPPFTPASTATILWSNSFETDLPGVYTNSFGAWTVLTNQVEIVTNPPAYAGSQLLQLDDGVVTTTLPTVLGEKYVLSYLLGSRVSDSTNAAAITNANWHSASVIFTANSAGTPLVLNASGVPITSTNAQVFTFDTNSVVDAFLLTTVPSDLYYQPEEDISDLNNQSAYGLWQLEIQDDRVGAGLTNALLSWELELVFANTNATYPPVITTAATNITSTSATLDALVYPGGLPTTLYFEYGTDSTALTNFSGTLALADLTSQQALGIAVSNLTPDTLYYFQAVTTNSAGITNYGGILTFFAHSGPLPYAATLPAKLVTGTSALLNGLATPNGLPSVAWFQWGTNVLYGNQTTPASVGSGFGVVYTTNQISGLITNVPYHFRLVVSNAFAVTYGFDQILDEAFVVAWGANYAGQIAVPTNLNNVVSIAAANDHSLALKTNGTVVGWGNNNFGQATMPAGLSNLVAVAGGDSFSMALKSSGTVVAWGASNLNQTIVPPAATNNVVNIASGTFSCLALKDNGSVVTWGLGFLNAPAGLSNLVALAGGRFHSLALKNDGTVTGWGDNGSGQLGVPANLSNVVAIAAGSFHSLALRYDGTVVGWGDSSAGQTNVPAGLSNVVAIAAGGFSSLALKSDGTVVGWGDNSAGQISVPLGLTNVLAISGGLLHSLALAPTLLSSTNPIALSDGVVLTNTIFAGGVNYYSVMVPTNADFATNLLFVVSASPVPTLNLWFSTNVPPSIIQPGDVILLANTTNGISILGTNSAPARIVPGATYYLGVQNTNNFAVTYGIGVNFHLVTATNTPPQTNTIPISSIVYTNIGGTNGFLLTWFAPSNDLFQVQWSDNLPFTWQTFTNIISYNTNVPVVNPTNAQFNFFDGGPFTGSRYYQLILLGSPASSTSNTPPSLPAQSLRVVNPLNLLTVTNTATDAQSPPQILTYALVNPPAGVTIDANGVITWTPTVAQAGTSNVFTTIVTDNGTPNLSATNSFVVHVNPVPDFSNVTFTAGGFLLTWWAPTNDIFEVEVSTNLASPVWQTLTNNITYSGPVTPTDGLFTYFDDPATTSVPFGSLRFYRLILTGVTTPSAGPSVTVPISSITVTGGNFLLTWFAPTTNQFNVQWTTNFVAPVTWTPFPGGPITSTNGTFSFMDTNAPMLMKFYELILLP